MKRNAAPALTLTLAVLLAGSLALQAESASEEPAIQVEYLEIVTTSPEATCSMLEKVHGVTFSDPVPELGTSRMALLSNGGRIAVRGPLRPNEAPVVRPYLLVSDIEAAVKAAAEAGAQVAMPPSQIPGQGMFAIYILGGIEHGLWQN